MTDPILTPREIADQVRVHVDTVMRALKSGELEGSQLNPRRGGWAIRQSAVDRWIELRSNKHHKQPALSQPIEVTPSTIDPFPSRYNKVYSRRRGVTADGRLIPVVPERKGHP